MRRPVAVPTGGRASSGVTDENTLLFLTEWEKTSSGGAAHPPPALSGTGAPGDAATSCKSAGGRCRWQTMRIKPALKKPIKKTELLCCSMTRAAPLVLEEPRQGVRGENSRARSSQHALNFTAVKIPGGLVIFNDRLPRRTDDSVLLDATSASSN